MSKLKVNVSILGEMEENERLYSVGIGSIGSSYPDIHTEFGFGSIDDAKSYVENMGKYDIVDLTIKDE